MATPQTAVPTAGPAARPDGSALAERVLTVPEHGTSYFYPAVATGVPIAVTAFAFAITVFGIVNSGLVPVTAINIFVPVALFTGGIGMFTGGIVEFRRDDVFGGTFGVAYACFLITTGAIVQWFGPVVTHAAGASGFRSAFGGYLIIWAAFTLMMSVGAFFLNVPAFFAFFLLAVVYAIFGIYNLVQPVSLTLAKVGGGIAIADGVFAFWVATSLVLNTTIGRNVVPLLPYPYRRRQAAAA
jgi:succinate-acetate transporter protein